MPESSIQRQEFQQKKPFFVAAAFCLAAVVFAVALFEQRVVAIKRSALEDLKTKVQPMLQKEAQMQESQTQVDTLKKETEKVTGMIDDRFFWVETLNEFRRVLVETEEKTKQKVGADAGVWIEIFQPQVPADMSFTPSASAYPSTPQIAAEPLPPELRYQDPGGKGEAPIASSPQPGSASAPGSGNEINRVSIVLRGIDLERVNPSANNDLVFILKDEIKASPFFAGDATVVESIKKDENSQTPSPTFTLNLTVQLKRSLKFKYPAE